MNRELILHIGLPKTGTTSIQHALGTRRKELLEKGVLYPVSPGDTNHALLPAAILGPDLDPRHFIPSTWEGMAPTARIERFRREFAEEMSKTPEHVRLIVLSAEHCGGFLKTRPAIQALSDMLRPYFTRCRIVVYLRRQDLFEASLYSERLKVGDLGPPRLPPGSPAELWPYNYEALLDLWAAVFGEEAIVVRIFERESLHNGDVVDDFLSTCGISIDIPPDDPNREHNMSMNRVGQLLMVQIGTRLRAQMGASAMESRLWRRIGRIISTVLPGSGWRPTRSVTEGFMARFAPGNEAVRRRFLPERKTLFTEDYASIPEKPNNADSRGLLSGAIDALMFEIRARAELEARYLLLQAQQQTQAGDLKAAKRCLHEAVSWNPDHFWARMKLADAFLKEGDLTSARDHVKKALQIQPDAVPAQNLLRRIATMEKSPASQGGP